VPAEREAAALPTEPLEREIDTWERLGESWHQLTVGAQVAAISSAIGIVGFLMFLFALAQAQLRASISLWILILPFVLSLYLLFSSSNAPLKSRILTYAAVAVLGALWLQTILTFPVQGLWWALSVLGLLGMIGGGFLALWDATNHLDA